MVNPVNQILVSSIIAENWGELSSLIRRSRVSEFKPRINVLTRDGRAVPGISFDTVARRRVRTLARYGRYIKTDISRFYPSIYTHSLPWAALGRDHYKLNRKGPLVSGHFTNDLDRAVASGQEGQTIGIPIGPDTSRIIAELVASEIDRILGSVFDDWEDRSVRYVDDMIVGVSDHESSEEIISKLSSALHDYQLEINLRKTYVFGPSSGHSPDWLHFLKTF